MPAILQQFGPEGPTARSVLEEPGPIVLGRSHDCAIQLDNSKVSRHHCLLRFHGGRWQVEDLDSSNGTYVNGKRTKRTELTDGDTISLGRPGPCLVFRLSEPAGASASTLDAVPGVRTLPRSDRPDARTDPAIAVLESGLSRARPSRPLGRRYELKELIHHGSTGAFYRARDLKLGRPVCLKILSKAVAQDEAQLKRFVRGVRTAGKLRHPNIVALHRAGRTGSHWWLAMEFVDGPSLRQVIAKFGVSKMLDPARVLAIARDITAALEVAYERQVLHRNIKPENILLTKGGSAKLSDFALVRGVVLDTLQRITASNEIIGDLAYMAPERTDPDGWVDCRSDIYSLGACLYALLAGRPPFTGRGAIEVIEHIRHHEPVPPSRVNLTVPGPLEGVVMRCLAKSATDRFQSPMELRAELVRVARFHR